MQRLQSFKFELMPNGEQQRDMRRFSGACRFVYNKALALQKTNYEAGGKFIGYVALAKSLTDWRNGTETPWLKDAPCHPLQRALKDLERAYKNFFAKRADFPRFKRKGSGESFRYPDAKQFEIDQANSRIKLPKLGWVRYRNSRDVLGQAKNITISQSGGKWYASIQTEREAPQPVPTATTAIGIDVGIARFATMSDGSFIAPLNSFKKHQQRLARYQRRMSRKVKFSNNWKKEKTKYKRFTPVSPMPAKTFCTRPLQRSAKTTRSSVLRICRFAICPGLPKAVANSTANGSSKRLDSIAPSWIRAGASSGGNWSTKWLGTAASCCRSRRTIPVRLALVAGTSPKKTGLNRLSFFASIAAMPKTPMWSAQSMF